MPAPIMGAGHLFSRRAREVDVGDRHPDLAD
jgi:hypothetical protein